MEKRVVRDYSIVTVPAIPPALVASVRSLVAVQAYVPGFEKQRFAYSFPCTVAATRQHRVALASDER